MSDESYFIWDLCQTEDRVICFSLVESRPVWVLLNLVLAL